MKAPMAINNPDLSASVAKAISSLRVELDANRITVNVQIRSVAWAAFLEKLQDMPLRDYSRAFRPGKKK